MKEMFNLRKVGKCTIQKDNDMYSVYLNGVSYARNVEHLRAYQIGTEQNPEYFVLLRTEAATRVVRVTEYSFEYISGIRGSSVFDDESIDIVISDSSYISFKPFSLEANLCVRPNIGSIKSLKEKIADTVSAVRNDNIIRGNVRVAC